MSSVDTSNFNEGELQALIALLDDPDQQVYNEVTSKLLSLGTNVIPTLESAWENSFDNVHQNRIEELIHKIQFEQNLKDLKQWREEKPDNLLAGTLLVARYQYPDLDLEKITGEISKIHKDIWVEMSDDLTGMEKVKVFNEIFYNIHGYGGNVKNLTDPQNSFINLVLETKKGNPISLGSIYLIVAQMMHLPIYGVKLPQHFIMAYMDEHLGLPLNIFEEEETEKSLYEKVLFYINPFNKGAIFSQKEILAYLRKMKIDPYGADGLLDEQHFSPCSNLEIIRLLIGQLMDSYQQMGFQEKVEDMKELLKAID